ncbi:MAG: Ig-like domain-containing protein, partial [Raoultibacter sp.]
GSGAEGAQPEQQPTNGQTAVDAEGAQAEVPQVTAPDSTTSEPAAPATDQTVLSDEALITFNTQHAYVTVKDQILDSSTLKAVLHEKLEFTVSADTGYVIDKVEAKNSATQAIVVLQEKDGLYTVAAEHVDSNLVIAVEAVADQAAAEEAEQSAATVPLTNGTALGRGGTVTEIPVSLYVGETKTIKGLCPTGMSTYGQGWSVLKGSDLVSFSGSTDIATVSIAGNGVGTAVLKHEYGIWAQPGYDTEYFLVTISAAVEITGASLAGMSAVESGTTATYSIAANPSNATIKSVAWSTSDDSIASVDQSGKLTAHAVGKVALKAHVEGLNMSLDLERTISVTKQLAKSVAVSGPECVVQGKTIEMRAEVTPADLGIGVTWSTSDESVATVDESGKVTGVKAGDVLVRATADDGSKVFGEKKVSVYGAESVTKQVLPYVTTAKISYNMSIEIPGDETVVPASAGIKTRFTA